MSTGSAISADRKVDILILISGAISWLILSFSAVRLSAIYAPNPVIAYLISFNIAALIYLIYFSAYLKNRFNYPALLLLYVVYNVGMHLFSYSYNNIVLIHPPVLNFTKMIVASAISFILMSIAYFPLRKTLMK